MVCFVLDSDGHSDYLVVLRIQESDVAPTGFESEDDDVGKREYCPRCQAAADREFELVR